MEERKGGTVAMADTDYHLLLLKYMMHVGEMEGVDYVFRTTDQPSYLTASEWLALQEASADSSALEDAMAKAREREKGEQ